MAPNHYLTKIMAEAHVEDLRRAVHRPGLARGAKEGTPRPIGNLEAPITIRPARSADASALAKLAALDSAEVPSLPVLIAEVTGQVRAAVSLHDGAAIADPFNHTAGMLQLLHARAAQLHRQYPVPRRHFSTVLRRLWGSAM
jgi:hypothetical protein